MTVQDAISVGMSVIFSLGGGATLVFALSSWLGKVWAERLMQSERHEHAKQLELLRTSVQLASEEHLSTLRSKLEVTRETHVREHVDRVAIYRSAIDLIAGIVAKVEMVMMQKRGPLSADELHEFETQRLRVYAYLAMHAPQPVMDAHDALTDVVLTVVHDGATVAWEDFRGLAIGFLNEVRKDVGIRPEPVAYRGSR
jgi:hypothetical protein